MRGEVGHTVCRMEVRPQVKWKAQTQRPTDTDSMVLHILGVLRSGRYARTHTLHTYVWYYLLWSNHSMYLQYGVMLHTLTTHICGVVYNRTRTYTRMCTCGYAVVVLRITS